jgi:hypothetical protein
MKTKTKIITLLIMIWQSILVAGLLLGIIFDIGSSGLSNFSFHYNLNFLAILDIIGFICLLCYIPAAIIGTIGLSQKRNYGRIFSILSMALIILAICANFAQNLFFVYLRDIIFDSSNIILFVVAGINILSIIYLDRLKMDNQSDVL